MYRSTLNPFIYIFTHLYSNQLAILKSDETDIEPNFEHFLPNNSLNNYTLYPHEYTYPQTIVSIVSMHTKARYQLNSTICDMLTISLTNKHKKQKERQQS